MQSITTIRSFLRVAPMLPAETSIMLRARTGCGKSDTIRYLAELIAKQLKLRNYPVIDRRLGQMTEGDIIGLPSTEGRKTRFNPVDWYVEACERPCLLFLDELNRATIEVMQAAFQIARDREMNGWKLHPETRVCTAINVGAEYMVNEIDPALLDRFWVVDLDPDIDDWLEWAKSPRGNIHSNLINFINDTRHTTRTEKSGSAKNGWLDPPANANHGEKQVSRRSWEALNNALVRANIIDKPDDAMFYTMCMGYVGVEAAAAFREYVKTCDRQVSGDDVINDYDSHRDTVKAMTQDQINDMISKVADYMLKNIKVLSDKQGSNLNYFMSDLSGELRIVCWTQLTKSGLDNLELTKSLHKHCAETLLAAFGVPKGEAGIGVTPKIPGMYKKPA